MFMGRILDRLLGFSASLRLAVGVILGLAAFLAIGTAYEARYSPRAAGEMVYQSPLFVGILALLALNVLAAAVIRFPWKRHQTGFVITHAGILVLLAGCLVGQRWGVDGRLTLRSPATGEADLVSRGESIELPREQLAVFDAADRPVAVFPIELREQAGFPSPLRFAVSPIRPLPKPPESFSRALGAFEGVTVTATAWHPAVRVGADGSVRPIRVKPDEIDSAVAAARVRLSAMGRDRETWVIRGERPVELQTPGGTIKLGYGFAAQMLPFAVELVEARRSPSGASSAAVRVRGFEYEIAPNRPATVEGLTIYLASVERVGESLVAFLSVRRDPGWPVKYAGCGLIVFGTAMMFVIRRKDRPAAVDEAAAVTADVPAGRRGRRRTSVAVPAAVMVLLAAGAAARGEADLGPLRTIPVEHDGRIKPLDTAAREIVRFVYGRETPDSLRTLLEWAGSPNAAAARAVIAVDHLGLRARFGVPDGEKRASRDQLLARADAWAWAAELTERSRAAEGAGELLELTKLERAAIDLHQRVRWFDAVRSGQSPQVMLRGGAVPVIDAPGWRALLAGVIADDPEALQAALASLRAELAPADADRLRREVGYHAAHPFRWTAGLYATALVVLLAGQIGGSRRRATVALSILAVATLAHAGAFAWRCSITGWAPVTNMYETVVWVGGVAAAIGLTLSLTGGVAAPALAGSVVAVLACVVGDVMPPEYGRSISRLAPVLQSNLWLTVHVLTVVSSYAAFAVALVLGNVALWQIARGTHEVLPVRFDPQDPATTNLRRSTSNLLLHVYRCVQMGVVLIAAGTVLGGVWADYSWGRFWGWDPKEVWALIVLLAYLALLHGRYAGWVGPFGLAAGAVVCFLTVLMSWYGVNFVLGTGLHSYGFGAGGLEYVLSYAAGQSAFVLWAWWRYRSAQGRVKESERRGASTSAAPRVEVGA